MVAVARHKRERRRTESAPSPRCGTYDDDLEIVTSVTVKMAAIFLEVDKYCFV